MARDNLIEKSLTVYLQRLLQGEPESNEQPTVILTLVPKVWDARLINEDSVIIDLSTCLAVRSELKIKHKNDFYPYNELLEAGWPINNIWLGTANMGWMNDDATHVVVADNMGNPCIAYINASSNFRLRILKKGNITRL